MKHSIKLLLCFVIISCNMAENTLNPRKFRKTINNEEINLYLLENKNDMKVYLCNFGARVVAITFPDKSGKTTDLTLGFDNIHDYQNINCNFGATIGRYANRISLAQFPLEGNNIRLTANNGQHCLHGGEYGWQTKTFKTKNITDSSIVFSYTSPDGDEGFPGNVSSEIKYSLTSNNELHISYYATTDKTTVINLTNHTFFNLSGNPGKTVLDHILYINASRYTPIDSTMIPTGKIETISGTPLDFRNPSVISSKIDFEYEQIKYAKGYDHNWILDTDGNIEVPAASLYSPQTGIMMEVFTDEPGIQVFTGNAFNGSFNGRKGIPYKDRPSVCFETQHFPDSPNNPQWPTTILKPKETYHSNCIYKFSIK